LKIVSFEGFFKNSLIEILLAVRSADNQLEELRFQKCAIPALEMKRIKRVKFTRCNEKSVEGFLNKNSHVVAFHGEYD
jgi:hypothetical protein